MSKKEPGFTSKPKQGIPKASNTALNSMKEKLLSKISIFAFILILSFGLFGFSQASAQNIFFPSSHEAQLRAQIQSLIQQLTSLMFQLQQAQGFSGRVLGANTFSPFPITGGRHDRNDAQRAIDNAEDEIDDADDEINDADDDDVDEDDIEDAEDRLDEAEDFLRDAERAFDRSLWDQAVTSARKARDRAKDAVDELDNFFTDKDRAERAIDDAEDAIDDAEDEIRDARRIGFGTEEAEDLLDRAEDRLNDAEDEFDDRDWDDAEDDAEEAEELAEDATDAIIRFAF